MSAATLRHSCSAPSGCLAGGYFAYKMVYPAALDFLIDYSKQFTPMITINEYTNLFMTIVLGLGVVFEMPILVFFLALFGIVSPGWMAEPALFDPRDLYHRGRHHSTTDIMNMCIFAAPMIVLYLASIGVAWFVHPKNRKKREMRTNDERAAGLLDTNPSAKEAHDSGSAVGRSDIAHRSLSRYQAASDTASAQAQSAPPVVVRAEDLTQAGYAPALKVSGQKAYQNLKDFVALGPRPLGSDGHSKAEQYILSHLDGAQIEQDKFKVDTAAGPFAMNNIVARFPGKKSGVIVLAGHYDTNYPLKNTSFVGANDAAPTWDSCWRLPASFAFIPEGTASGCSLPTARSHRCMDRRRQRLWRKTLAKKWSEDGSAATIKAFLLLDMIGDKDLDLDRDTNSTPWLVDVVYRAAQRVASSRTFLLAATQSRMTISPSARLEFQWLTSSTSIRFDNLYHHTTQDTPDKCSAASLQIVGDIVMESIRALNTR